MAFSAYRHRAIKGYLIPKRNPSEVVDESRSYTKAQAANLLGVDRATIDQLIEDERLEIDDAGRIPGESLAELADELEPVRLEIVEVGARDADDAADDKEPVASKAKARPVGRKVMVAEEAGSEKEPATWSAECPSCGEEFNVAGEVERFRCPGCGATLTVATESEKPAAANPRRKRFLGVF